MRRRSAWLGLAFLIALAGCLPGYLSNQRMAKEGSLAPPITGVDAQGQTMRLRDFDGKVVLLSFWHSHCPPCRAMFPHEKELVKRFAGQPFVLVGVNADESPFELRKTQEKAGLNWASWWDGMGGPIATVWGVDRFPAFFLIDQEGVVRLRHLGVPEEGMLEKKIEELLNPSVAMAKKR